MDMADTMDSFFDKNKLYLKTALHEETQRQKGDPANIHITHDSVFQESKNAAM